METSVSPPADSIVGTAPSQGDKPNSRTSSRLRLKKAYEATEPSTEAPLSSDTAAPLKSGRLKPSKAAVSASNDDEATDDDDDTNRAAPQKNRAIRTGGLCFTRCYTVCTVFILLMACLMWYVMSLRCSQGTRCARQIRRTKGSTLCSTFVIVSYYGSEACSQARC